MIVALVNGKGGCGKTSIALQLAGEALTRGLRVLIADGDTQRAATQLGDRAHASGGPAPTVVGVTETLRKTLPELAASYDLTFIDCGPHGDAVPRAALMTADVALVPLMPSAQDLDATATFATLILEAQALRPELQARLVLNRLQPRTAISRSLLDAASAIGIPLMAAKLEQRVAFADTLAAGQTVASAAPKGAAAREVRALFNEVLSLAPTPKEPTNHGKKGRAARRG